MKLYFHPPRGRQIKMTDNINAMIMNERKEDNHRVYTPTTEDKVKYKPNMKDGWIKPLIEEVTKNGYKYDLCLLCHKDKDGNVPECKHNDYSILKVVDDKMSHPRHQAIDCPLRRDEMLSLILYTGNTLYFIFIFLLQIMFKYHYIF